MATISAAARSVLRSVTTTSARSTSPSRVTTGAKPNSLGRSTPRILNQKPLSARFFRSPVELSSVCVESLLPYHTVTASALLTSMLSVSLRNHAWTLEDS